MRKSPNEKKGSQSFSAPATITPTVPMPMPQTLSIEQALALAAQHQEAGRLAQAEDILNKIVQVQPANAQALHLLGICAHMAGNNELAADLVGRAIKSNGDWAIFHANRAEMCRLLKRLDEAVAHGQQAVSLDPRLLAGHSNLGIAYYDRKEYDRAESCHEAALKINPDFAPSLNNMGSILRDDRKDFEGAIDYYRRAARANPDYLEPLNNLGATLAQSDKPEEALAVLNQALVQNPRYAEAHCNRGFALLSLEKYPQCLACFETTLRLRADYPEAWQGIARAFKELYELEKAEAAALESLELDPAKPEAHATLGSIYVAQGHPERAKACFARALEIDSDLSSGKMGLGNIYLEEGRFKEAEEIFRTVIDVPGERAGALFSMAQTKKVKPGDDIIAMLEAEAEKLDSLPENKASYVHFALGKIYDDLGDAERAFPHFIAGCAIKRRRIEYDADEKDAYFRRVEKTFTRSFIDSHRGHGDSSDLPVFVLGMPRSGTTLTEQIIASHPDVFGAGELFDLINLAQSTEKSSDPEFPETMETMKPAGMKEMARQYVEGLQARDPNAKRITDKMPANFLHIGLIHLILPNAKIVHVNRNPLDTCISCYTRLFAHNQNQTYELNELGRYYRGYNDLMKHWRAVLPAGAFHDVQYEALVDDTETEARRLIEYCGLDWNEACLAFHKNKRNVRTASVHQVRQPIYKTSVARWKKYETFLGPLIEGLGDAFMQED